ncbi:MAG: phosphoglucosamine mutase [Thiohalophilus sp.]|uniref:phosphoglucosamine mutase n=1 Tax=Thiohalophilus sp. TaxID=3028392 RepID=UPI0028702435|nr:phosphoglucosamine mutase [Thiohalophilus sp.]MDR9435779.1 phosphoglucosamine mutase [Thiohalophilus sp.]
MSRKYFGTDGVRGRVGEFPITPEFILKLGWAAGRVLGDGGGKVLIGKDTRISGYIFESALEAGLAAAGMNVCLLGPMPTPGIAHLTRTLHARAGIVISASHNAYPDNGIKFFSAEGTKLPDEVELAIEAMIDQELVTSAPDKLGRANRVDDAAGRYIEFCKSTFPEHLDLNGLHIVLDCANGATYQIAPKVFAELGAELTVIGNDPDGLNINDGCGSTHLEWLQKKVQLQGADLGIAFDGDGDRVLMVDREGRVIDGDELLYVMTTHRQRMQRLKGGVVGTLMTNLGMEHALQAAGVPFVRARVGDRYVMEQLQAHSWELGGEGSGHLICLDKTSTGDGIVAALQVLAAVVESGRTLTDLVSGMDKYPQQLINVRLARKVDVLATPEVQAAVAAAESELAARGRVLLRPSGTEPLLRVMVEGQDAGEVLRVAQELAGVVEQTLGSG